MERKGRLRLLPHIPLPRTGSKTAVTVLTVCMIICILSGTVPLSWYGLSDGVYAAETVSREEPGPEAAREQVPGEDGSSDNNSAADPGKKSEETADDDGSGVSGSEDPEEPSRDSADSAEEAAESAEETSASRKEDTASGAGTSEAAQKEEDKPGQDAVPDASTQNQAAEEQASEKQAAEKDVSRSTDAQTNASDDDHARDRDGAQAGADPAPAEKDSPAGADSAAAPASDPAASAAVPQTVQEEEPWMTVEEFERAYNSVTKGALKGSGYVPDRARIVSKYSEIDYEKLGIGYEGDGHNGRTTPVRIKDENDNEMYGLCVVPDDRGHNTWSLLPDIRKVTDAQMIKLFYYTAFDKYGEKLAKERGFGSKAGTVAVAACHEAMSMRYAELAGISYDRPNIEDKLKSLVKAYRSGVSAKALPDLNKVHVYVSGRTKKEGHWIQAYVFGFVEEDEVSGIVLRKICSDPDMQAAYNDCYCLHETADGGAVHFGVYTDKACTKKAQVYGDKDLKTELASVSVGMSSKSGLTNRAAFYCVEGTYYLKELDTPRGYQEYREVLGPYTVKDGQGLTITVTNTPRYARAGIIKKDADTAQVLAGARYGLYTSMEDARNEEDPAGIFTTGADGKSNLLEVLALKTYYVREISAPEGYKRDTGIYTLKTAQNVTDLVWTELSDKPDDGKVRVRKASSDPDVDTDIEGGIYSLEGAVYTLFNEKGESVGTLKTEKDGVSQYLTVPRGSYTLKETAASPGFGLDSTVHPVNVTGGSEITVESAEPVTKGKIMVRKVSSEEKEEKASDTLPVSGAVYGLYNSGEDASEGRPAAGTFVIGQDGTSNIVEVIAGKTYYVKEIKTPEGYLPDEKIYTAKVDSLTETVTVRSEDQLIFGGVRVCKRDLETGRSKPLGGASLEGTVIKIYNDGDLSVYADGRKILPGAEALTLVTAADGTAQTSDHALSYGSYRAEESLPPEGYTGIGAQPVRFTVTENGKITDLSASPQTSLKNRVMRGDFSLRKINGYTQRRMAGVTFEVTSYDRDGKELEKQRFTTDENGFFESTAAWAAKQDSSERIWFGIGTKPDDTLGALPFGSYHIEEIEGENNRGMKMFSDDFSIYAEKQTLMLGNIENTLKPALDTELVDENGDHFADQKGVITLTDTVTYTGMEEYIGREVTFHGVIYVKETGKPLQIDNKTVESVETRKILSHSATVQLRFTFDASRVQGMTLVCFEYASEPLEGGGGTETPGGRDEGSYHDSTNGGKDIVSHTDLEEESQTVHLVSIETDAEDQLTGMKIGQARGGAVTVDHVTCRGLTPGQAYLVTGFLVDKSTGRPLRDAKGEEITAEASFAAEKTEEIVDLTFTYDASLLEGTTVVAFERLYLKGDRTPDKPGEDTPEKPDVPTQDEPDTDTPIAVHEDPDDEDQSIHYPRIRTNAEVGKANAGASDEAAAAVGKEDSADGSGTVMEKTVTADGKLIVRDRVTWENLIPGMNFSLQGVLMDKRTGKPFVTGGKTVTAQAEFTPQAKDGETVLYFSFDAAGLFGNLDPETDRGITAADMQEAQILQLVAFEELYISGGNLVAEHKDLQDPAQTVIVREPQKPEEPEKPEKPGRPGNPEKPESTRSNKKKISPAAPETVRTGTPVRTGDDTKIGLYLLPVVLSAIAVAGLLIARRHMQDGKK